MNLLFRIVYAAHASGTHHKLALDALRHLKCMDADLWQRLFLATPSSTWKAPRRPTTSSRIQEPRAAHARRLLGRRAGKGAQLVPAPGRGARASRTGTTAVYCAGVLSHYYTDPLHPFHTAQSEAENNIHRAVRVEHLARPTTSCATLGEREFPNIDVELPAGPELAGRSCCASGAETANG